MLGDVKLCLETTIYAVVRGTQPEALSGVFDLDQ